MPLELVQCAANVSEGRDPAVLDALAAAVSSTPGVALVDLSPDEDHHRAVLTFLGPPEAVGRAALALAAAAVARIDLTHHRGAHPRMGALDVLPFVPLCGVTLDTCVHLAHEVGVRIAGSLDVPVYFYEEAALRPERRNLAEIRRGGFEALVAGPLMGEREPDAGPCSAHPTAGAVAVGARNPLLAYNVELHTADPEIARAVAERVRERGGGLVGLRALGLQLDRRQRLQVSLNITQPHRTPLYRVHELVRLEAARYGVAVAGGELIGTLRLEDLLETVRYYLGLRSLRPEQVLDLWIARMEAAAELPGGDGAVEPSGGGSGRA